MSSIAVFDFYLMTKKKNDNNSDNITIDSLIHVNDCMDLISWSKIQNFLGFRICKSSCSRLKDSVFCSYYCFYSVFMKSVMSKWWVLNLKYKELYERYNQQPEPKVKRSYFANRVLRCNITKTEALNPWSLLSFWKLKRFGSIVKEDWRVCTKCKQFKLRDEFAKNKTGFNWKTCDCKECRNKAKAEYRKRTNRSWDKKYKEERRHLKIWDQISFDDNIREVLSYKFKKWYTVKSILTGAERIIDTNDNHNAPINHCVRFTKLKEKIQTTASKETEAEFF